MTRFRILPQESTIDLTGRSSVHPLHGKAGSVSGTIEVELGPDGMPDLDQPYSAEITLPATAISWGGAMYDRETQRRLDVRTYPSIKASVEHAAAVEGNTDVAVLVNLTLRGQTRPIEGRASLQVEPGRLVAEGERVIDIRDFGMDPPRLLMLKVDPLVTVRARIVAVADA